MHIESQIQTGHVAQPRAPGRLWTDPISSLKTMPILAPFQAFARDATVLNVEEDESRLPVKWLAAAQVASRIADSRQSERKALLKLWSEQQQQDGEDGVWSALAVPGIPVRDLASAAAALCHIAADMERGGALNLAYSTVTNMRIAMLERGPAGARGQATFQQARVLRQMGLLEEAEDTFTEAREDALRANDFELEGRALEGLAAVVGQRGNYPAVIRFATEALARLSPTSESLPAAHGALMIAYGRLKNFESALEHGWRGYDLADTVERRAMIVGNQATLALRSGEFDAARRAFLAAFAMTPHTRMKLPALGGLALVAAARKDLSALSQAAKTLEILPGANAFPFELAQARFEFAQAWKEIGKLDESEQCLAGVRELTATHSFNEIDFASDVLSDAIATARGPRSSSSFATAPPRSNDLPVDDAALAAV
jgi:tetratricopeptide (TPR) repeat protein